MTIRTSETPQEPGTQAAIPAQLSLHDRMSEAVRVAADPLRLARYLGDFAEKHPDTLRALSLQPEGLSALASIATLSRFLAEECLRHPEWLLGVGDLNTASGLPEYASRLQAFLSVHTGEPALALALFHRKELLRIALRDGLERASIAELTAEISDLADAILGRALEIVMTELRMRFGTPQTAGAPTPFSVLALGKLGGRELNYSSDIDLMFLYGANGETSGASQISNKEFFKKAANQLTGMLSTYTAAGVCYRVDLRLRPEGSLGEVALSLDAAKDYYSKRARDWELQMLIKARVAAGDAALGHELLESVEPSIYSTTLDFSTIETMSATRERISEKLAKRRMRQAQLDVKLAPGGIRDIEFLVQCLQRLHGARDLAVRHGGTLFALSRLHEKGMLSNGEHARLAGAYEFLRHLEHRLQLEDGKQTHALPNDPMSLEALAKRLPSVYGSPARSNTSARLLQLLNQHLENVQVIYDRIVHAQRPLSYVPNDMPPLASRLQASGPATGSNLAGEPASREVPTFTAFVESLQAEPYYVHLLETNHLTADYALQILEHSPYLAAQLKSTPELLDEVQYVAEAPAARPAFEALAGPLNDIDGLRAFFRRQMFRILAGSICIPEPIFATLDRTSSLAEFMIARAYRIALEQELVKGHFVEPTQQMAVVALGRLGVREFDLGSDADLVFIIPDSELERQQFWTKVAEHMIGILTHYHGGGPILSLDTRLRPNGREGLLVQSESSYSEYFEHKAEAWEGIAYMKARAVAGDVDRATSFLTDLQQLDWRRYGQSGRSRRDLREMRLRVQREHGAATPLKAAAGGYYDADFILMYLRLKGAGLFFRTLNTPERIDIVEKMGHLERDDAAFLLEVTTHFRALDHALRIVSGRALERLPESLPERQMIADLLQRWTQKPVSAEALDDQLKARQQGMRRLFDSIFQRPPVL